MTQLFNLRSLERLHQLVGFTASLSLLLSIGPSSLADSLPSAASQGVGDSIQTPASGGRAYTPPADSRISDSDHTGGGVRGCGDDIAALAPRLNSTGQTISTRPTFIWYMYGDTADPLEFHLYRYRPDDSLEEVLITPIGPSTQGYMAYTLPSDKPDLNVDDAYLWQVVQYCDQHLQEVGQWTSADIEIVESPVNLALGLPQDSLQKAQAYARAGLWYDALANVYDAKTPEEQAFRQDLLLDLADLEEQPDEDPGVDLSALLRQIAEMP